MDVKLFGEISTSSSSDEGFGIRIVDLKKIKEDEEDSSSEQKPVLPRPQTPIDPKLLRECFVKLRRVEEELKIIGPVGAAGTNDGVGIGVIDRPVRNQKPLTAGGRLSKYTNCPKCQKSIVRNHLKRHLDTHNTDRKKDFSCELCNISFFRRDHWLRHMLIHSGEEEKFKCVPCNRKFFRRDKLLAHQRTKLHLEKTIDAE